MTGTVAASPEPTEGEAAAIAAAVEIVLATRVGIHAAATPSRWRWSGRWWSRPVPARRDRPV
ncbi:MAG: hypothetical protein FJW94_07375 [Actinobacteria bacterium]|nr:hypothetical protein [Actinomycetota bacterium]